MKRSRSFLEGMRASSVALSPLTHQYSALMGLPQTPVSLPSPELQRGSALPEHFRESPSESASSRETWPAEQPGHGKRALLPERLKNDEQFNIDHSQRAEQTVVHRVSNYDCLKLKDVACEPIEAVARRMHEQPDELSEDLKAELREILNGTGGAQQREEFALLQKWLLSRVDLSPELLMQANRTQLEILVAIKTGIQAFLHPDISVTQSLLIEVFFYKRCRNMACQNQLPGDECACEVCSTKTGFCNACMCTICSKFDFDVNTCRWIGCDFCAHWIHTDCAIRVGQIAMGASLKGSGGTSEMLFKCRACKCTSELLGWVKDVFCTCAGDWEREELIKEFDSVRRIFHGSEDFKGRKLFWKSEELLVRLKNGADDRAVCKEMQNFFQGGFQRGEKFWEKLTEAFSRIGDTILDCEPGVGDLAGLVVRMGRRTVCLCDKMDGRYLRRMLPPASRKLAVLDLNMVLLYRRLKTAGDKPKSISC